MSVVMCLKLSSHTLEFNYFPKGQSKTTNKKLMASLDEDIVMSILDR